MTSPGKATPWTSILAAATAIAAAASSPIFESEKFVKDFVWGRRIRRSKRFSLFFFSLSVVVFGCAMKFAVYVAKILHQN